RLRYVTPGFCEASTHRFQAGNAWQDPGPATHVGMLQELVAAPDRFGNRCRAEVECSCEIGEAGEGRPARALKVPGGSLCRLRRSPEPKTDRAVHESDRAPGPAERPIVADSLEYRNRLRGDVKQLIGGLPPLANEVHTRELQTSTELKPAVTGGTRGLDRLAHHV